MPVIPPPTRWVLEAPPDNHPDDVVAVGADLEPGTLLAAYRAGLCPMPASGTIAWWSPVERAIVPLPTPARVRASRVGGAPRLSRSLRRAQRRFEIRVDTAFVDVIAGCADPRRPHGWIDGQIVSAYTRLHELGWAHSIEAWDDEGLAGGLYGVSIGGLFAAESMFRHRTDASKAAFVALLELLAAAGDAAERLLDCQWLTPHLTTLGAVATTRADYTRRLAAALELPDAFGED